MDVKDMIFINLMLHQLAIIVSYLATHSQTIPLITILLQSLDLDMIFALKDRRVREINNN